MRTDRRGFITMLVGGLVAPIGTLAEVKGVQRPGSSQVHLPVDSDFPSLDGATGWLNSQPLTAAELRGKVVLIDFWTYTCINWRRSLPYVRAWADKYKDYGLVVIGVHSPEFEFEKDFGNVQRAVKDIGVDHPVAIDSDHAIWRAFMNQYWPARYFVDAQGRIRDHQFGEGEYEHGEAIIRQLLIEAGTSGLDRQPALVDPRACRACRGLGKSEIPGNLCPIRRRRDIRVSGRYRTRPAPRLHAAAAVEPQSLGSCGRLDSAGTRSRAAPG